MHSSNLIYVVVQVPIPYEHIWIRANWGLRTALVEAKPAANLRIWLGIQHKETIAGECAMHFDGNFAACPGCSDSKTS